MAAAQRWVRKRGRGGGAAQRGQQEWSGDRRTAAHQFECAFRVRDDAGRSGVPGSTRRGATFAIPAKSHTGKTYSRHAQWRSDVSHSVSRARHASLRAQSVAVGGAGGLRPVL